MAKAAERLALLLQNILTYILRFAGDLVSLLIGGISAVPLLYSYFDASRRIASSTVKWGCLALGFVIVSYRIWARTEAARTSDAVLVLLSDSTKIRDFLKWVIEHYDWPPTYWEGDKQLSMTRPMRGEFSTVDAGVIRELRKVRQRILDHNQLVQEVETTHNIQPIRKLDPDEMHQQTMLIDFDDYIGRLAALSRPPPSLFESLSQRRYLR